MPQEIETGDMINTKEMLCGQIDWAKANFSLWTVWICDVA